MYQYVYWICCCDLYHCVHLWCSGFIRWIKILDLINAVSTTSVLRFVRWAKYIELRARKSSNTSIFSKILIVCMVWLIDYMGNYILHLRCIFVCQNGNNYQFHWYQLYQNVESVIILCMRPGKEGRRVPIFRAHTQNDHCRMYPCLLFTAFHDQMMTIELIL